MKMFMSVKKKNKPRLRKLLEDCLLVFQVGGEQRDTFEGSFFFAVGHINFSTWRYSLIHLDFVEEHADGIVLQVPPQPAHHAVRTSVQFFAENINFEGSWTIQFWTILNDDAILVESEMRADLVECKKDTELEKVVFWEGSEAEKRKRKKTVDKETQRNSSTKRKVDKTDRGGQEKSKKRRTRKSDHEEQDEPLPLPDNDSDPESNSNQREFDRESNVSQVLESGSDFFENYDLSPPSSTSAISLFGGMEDLQDFLSEERSADPDTPNIDQNPPDHEAEAVAVAVPDAPVPLPEGEGQAAKSKAPRSAPVYKSDDKQSEYVFMLPDLGEIRYSYTNFYMRAYCGTHGRQCTRQRTCVPTKSTNAKGRPVGLLTAWLQGAKDFADAKSHMKATVPSHDVRKSAREQIYSITGGKNFADLFEEKAKKGEPEEPLRIKW